MNNPRNTPHLDARIYRPVDMSWREDARCLDADPELFFYAEEERGAPKQRHADNARAVCQRCDVSTACLAEAVRTREMHGIRGGVDFTNPAERDRAAREIGAVA